MISFPQWHPLMKPSKVPGVLRLNCLTELNQWPCMSYIKGYFCIWNLSQVTWNLSQVQCVHFSLSQSESLQSKSWCLVLVFLPGDGMFGQTVYSTDQHLAYLCYSKMAFGCFWCTVHDKLCEAEKLLNLSQYIFFFAMHQSSSSNCHCESSQTWVWISSSISYIEHFSSLLTWSNKHCAVDAGMKKEGQKSSGISLAYLLPVACKHGNPKNWSALDKLFHQSQILRLNKLFCFCLFYDFYLIMIDHTQLGTELEIWDLLCLDTPGYPSDSRWWARWAGCFWQSFVLLAPPTLLLIGCCLPVLGYTGGRVDTTELLEGGESFRSRDGGVDQIFTVRHYWMSRRSTVLVFDASSAGRPSRSSVLISPACAYLPWDSFESLLEWAAPRARQLCD